MSTKSMMAAALVLLAGLLIRLPGLAVPPLAFHPTRQYRSAILARNYFLGQTTDVTPPEVAAARQAAAQLGDIEPPIMEHLAAWAYQVSGHEDLRLPRLMSIVAWTAGGCALLWLLAQTCSTAAAMLAGLVVLMWLPFSVVATQAFQPDPLMVALTVLSMAVAVRHDRRPTIGWWLILGASAEAAMVVKPMAVFFLVPLVAILAVARDGWRRGLVLAGLWATAISLPVGVYYRGMAEARIDGLFLQLYRDPAFWRNWGAVLDRVVGQPLLLVALVGVAVAAPGLRRVLLALWFGYILFGVAFAYRVSTHDYYSLPLIPVVALSVAALVEAVERWSPGRLVTRTCVVVVLAAVFAVNGRAVQAAGLFPSRVDLQTEAARYEHIGRLTGHSARVLSLDGDYGLPLSYHGWVSATNWPLSFDLALLRAAGQSDAVHTEERLVGSGAEFFVATVQAELDAQPELRDLLNRRFSVIERDGSPDRWRFVVFDLRSTRISITPDRLDFVALTSGTASSRGAVALWSDESTHWRVEPPIPALFDVRPRDGTGPATLELTPVALPAPVDRIVQVPVFTGSGTAPAGTLAVRVRAVATRPAGAPFGFVDAPADPIVLGADPIALQGWALDNFDFRRVFVGHADGKGGIVSLGDAVLSGMRPDIAAAFPNAQNLSNDAWAFVLEPAALSGVPRPVLLHVYAENGNGDRVEIGRRTVVGR